MDKNCTVCNLKLNGVNYLTHRTVCKNLVFLRIGEKTTRALHTITKSQKWW